MLHFSKMFIACFIPHQQQNTTECSRFLYWTAFLDYFASFESKQGYYVRFVHYIVLFVKTWRRLHCPLLVRLSSV